MDCQTAKFNSPLKFPAIRHDTGLVGNAYINHAYDTGACNTSCMHSVVLLHLYNATFLTSFGKTHKDDASLRKFFGTTTLDTSQ